MVIETVNPKPLNPQLEKLSPNHPALDHDFQRNLKLGVHEMRIDQTLYLCLGLRVDQRHTHTDRDTHTHTRKNKQTNKQTNREVGPWTLHDGPYKHAAKPLSTLKTVSLSSKRKLKGTRDLKPGFESKKVSISDSLEVNLDFLLRFLYKASLYGSRWGRVVLFSFFVGVNSDPSCKGKGSIKDS